MQVQNITMTRAKARELYRAYKTHTNYQQPEDYQIMRTAQLIAKGKVIIQALESIRQAGINERGLPRLAICRADVKWCYLKKDQWGGVTFSGATYPSHKSRKAIHLPTGFFPRSSVSIEWHHHTRAAVPFIPPQHRPKRGLANYHILWEAVWENQPPVDPYLLRRIGDSDMWLVVAAWDLTEVERAAMRTKMLIH